ncbi:hypothetical protein K469DRAFT_554839 [Zopfia rhizophila CBS 207.26]|uniref:F-box domain-containing protein n=1 Tax=Zopfia rhizophila CBS 207.26 TaxID=1314779 RepID=A0A6A6EMB7_9PEZI|nr:hypothetical protein K469DRAFT_554839 [Zopfia rhizophila CBS 207.26]
MDRDNPQPFLSLPSELIYHILTFLSLRDLLSVSQVDHALHEHSLQDTLWQPFVQSHVSGTTLSKPDNITWRELYRTHHPYWFIPQNKLWFADNPHTGKLLIARYNHRLNIIEAYMLVAERRQPAFTHWDWNPEAIIHTFSPRIQLDANQPVIRLDADGYGRAVGEKGYRLKREIPMNITGDPPGASAGIYSQLILTRPLPEPAITEATKVWPPSIIPSPHRTRTESSTQFRDLGHRPSKLSELSTSTFRLRKWIEFSSRPRGVSMRIGEDVRTYATLPAECYTPTKEKPWQGIWCGDYSGHGCEFLLVTQPDDPAPLPARAEWVMLNREREGSVSSAGSWSTAPSSAPNPADQNWGLVDEQEGIAGSLNLEDSVATLLAPSSPRDSTPAQASPHPEADCIYKGRIEAIKLTGDPNIPRGEYTFIAPDIGPNGLVRIASEDIFKGARVVKSVGHIAARDFRDDDYIVSQLILISPNRLAQYWETFGHVSFYQRVDIDEFTKVP